MLVTLRIVTSAISNNLYSSVFCQSREVLMVTSLCQGATTTRRTSRASGEKNSETSNKRQGWTNDDQGCRIRLMKVSNSQLVPVVYAASL